MGAHPRWLNICTSTEELQVPFPTVEEVCAEAKKGFGLQFDFAWFFGHFPLDEEVARYFAIGKDQRLFIPTTVPTGARQPRLFCQIIAKAITARVLRIGNRLKTPIKGPVVAQSYIDNIRFTSDSESGYLNKHTLVTDASLSGWGAILFADTDVAYCGKWKGVESHTRIALLELKAIRLALERMPRTDSECLLDIVVDNTSVLGQVKRGRSRCQPRTGAHRKSV